MFQPDMVQPNGNSNCQSTNSNHWQTKCIVFVALIAVGVLGRWLIALPNFHPVAAIAFFGGFYFRRHWFAFAAVLIAMAVGDLLIGGYRWQMMVIIYAGLLAPVLIGRWLVHDKQPTLTIANRVLIGSLVASGIFFVLTNWAFWQFTAVYPKTAIGLVECYLAALPFLRFTVLSNLVFSSTFFLLWCCLSRWLPAVLSDRRQVSAAS
jgi:hypothetical protein